ncbi:hypothetical protein ACOMHN_043206 [Nucella lapillus]
MSREHSDHLRRIFEATLSNDAQELSTALQHFRRSKGHNHCSSPPSLSPLSNSSLLFRYRCPHSPHSYHPYYYRQQRRRAPVRQCRSRTLRQRQAADHSQLSYIVFQVITSGTARDSANLAFDQLRNKYTLQDAVAHTGILVTPSPDLGRVPTVAQYVSTPLHLAAALGLVPALKVLLRHKDVLNCLRERDSLDHTPLSAAVVSQKVDVISLVLKTLSLSRQLHEDVFKEIITDALKIAISLGERPDGVVVVGAILNEPRARRLVSWTPQMLCGPVARRNLPLLRLLLPCCCCSSGGFRSLLPQRHPGSCLLAKNPLHLAVYMYRNGTQEELEIVRCLLHYGADPNPLCFIQSVKPTHASALHIAVMTYDASDGRLLAPVPDIVHALLEYNADPRACDGLGESPLMWMRPGSCVKTLQLLLQYGANPWQTNHNNNVYLTSPMFLSHSNEDAGFLSVKVLLDHDPSLVNARGHQGRTILHHSILKPRLFWFLLSRGANPDLFDHDGDSVMDHLLTMQSTVPELTQRCLTLLMCVKVRASFSRSGNHRTILGYSHPTNTSAEDIIRQGQKWQVVMMEILFEVGYLTAGDRIHYFLQAANYDLPDSMKDVLKNLAGKPTSLVSTCRRAIVRSSGPCSRSRELVKSLLQNSPGAIKRYLHFSDLVRHVAAIMGRSVKEVQDFFSPLPPSVAARNLCLEL